jgi:hypothetical protein
MASLVELLQKDGCILEVNAEEMYVTGCSLLRMMKAINQIDYSVLEVGQLASVGVFIQILARLNLSKQKIIEIMPLFLGSLSRTLDHHRPTHPEIVEDCVSKMWMLVRKLVIGSTPTLEPLCPIAPYVAPILALMLPHVFEVFRMDRSRVQVVRDALTFFAIAIDCDKAGVVVAIGKAGLWGKLSSVAAFIDGGDSDTQSTAIEIMANLKDDIPPVPVLVFILSCLVVLVLSSCIGLCLVILELFSYLEFVLLSSLLPHSLPPGE